MVLSKPYGWVSRERTQQGRVRGVVAALAVSVVVAGCAPAPSLPVPRDGGLDPDLVERAGEPAYRQEGPFGVGVTTVEIEPGRKMEVWYPADTTAGTPERYYLRDFVAPALQALLPPSANPPFETSGVRDAPPVPGEQRPLVLFSHGAMGYRLQSTVLTTHLASWGFVVMSPDYFERGLQSLLGEGLPPTRTSAKVTEFAMAAATALNADGQLAGLIDTSRLFPIGHSAGGSQSTQLAGSRTDVQSWISLASGVNLTPSIFNQNPTVPAGLADPEKTVMWIAGANDKVSSSQSSIDAFGYTSGERKLVVIPGAGHNNAFTDLCEIGRDEGGLIGLAQSGGLVLPEFVTRLAQDGCFSPPNYLGPDVWPVVNHFVTAELRYRAGLDPEPVGLGREVVDAFGDVVPTYRHDE